VLLLQLLMLAACHWELLWLGCPADQPEQQQLLLLLLLLFLMVVVG
jgi:hypothetical protein